MVCVTKDTDIPYIVHSTSLSVAPSVCLSVWTLCLCCLSDFSRSALLFSASTLRLLNVKALKVFCLLLQMKDQKHDEIWGKMSVCKYQI